MHILLTGGAGYIGSHTYLALRRSGHVPVILDDLSNSDIGVISKLAELSGGPVVFERGSIADGPQLSRLFEKYQFSAVMHFAGFKAVGESVGDPLKYYRNNLSGLITLLSVMTQTSCRAFVFSSSATVYGDPKTLPLYEWSERSHTNPYGHTKLVGEDILTSLQKSDESWRIGILRYFNPVGADKSGEIGECPTGYPNNLMPFLAQVALGIRPYLQIFGDDYPTRDGTGVRDYIHVCDLADGHVAAVRHLLDHDGSSFTANLGTGVGTSVLELLHEFESASGRKIPYKIVGRRSGDVPAYYADPTCAARLLDWRARYTVADMCADTWRWNVNHPRGYKHEECITNIEPAQNRSEQITVPAGLQVSAAQSAVLLSEPSECLGEVLRFEVRPEVVNNKEVRVDRLNR